MFIPLYILKGNSIAMSTSTLARIFVRYGQCVIYCLTHFKMQDCRCLQLHAIVYNYIPFFSQHCQLFMMHKIRHWDLRPFDSVRKTI